MFRLILAAAAVTILLVRGRAGETHTVARRSTAPPLPEPGTKIEQIGLYMASNPLEGAAPSGPPPTRSAWILAFDGPNGQPVGVYVAGGIPDVREGTGIVVKGTVALSPQGVRYIEAKSWRRLA